ncbi:MAG: AI-2E family transporter, partial [Clostridia bacterium]|nr:AI-2E family transporter [Clostridia bacterium]
MEITEKRKATLVNIAYYTVIVALFYLFMKYAFGLVAPFIVAFAVAIILQKPIRIISEKTKIKKNILGAVAVLLIISVVIAAIVLVGYRLFVEFKGFGEYIMSKMSDLPALVRSAESWILARLAVLPDTLEKTVSDSVTGIVDRLLLATQEETANMPQPGEGGFDLSFLATPLGGILSTAKQIPVIFAGIFMGIIACFFITCDYDKFRMLISENISQEHEAAIVKTRRLLGDILG